MTSPLRIPEQAPATEASDDEDTENHRSPRRRQLKAFQLFFPGATLFAGLSVPLWVLQYLGIVAPWPEGAGNWHAHEMVFGYALAVVAGYLITKGSTVIVLGAFCTWLAARVMYIIPPLPAPVEAIAALAFPAVLFALGGFPFLRAAKGLRNAVFGLLLAGFLGAEALYQLGTFNLLPAGQDRGIILAIDLVVLLLFTMGGRVIAAATSGAIQRKGEYLKGVTQPRLERVGVVALVVMSLLDVLKWGEPASAIAVFVAAFIVILRLFRWQVWRVAAILDVSSLHLGYAWLAVGLLVKAGAQGFGVMSVLESTHLLTVGGLGTLSLAVMARVVLQRLRAPSRCTTEPNRLKCRTDSTHNWMRVGAQVTFFAGYFPDTMRTQKSLPCGRLCKSLIFGCGGRICSSPYTIEACLKVVAGARYQPFRIPVSAFVPLPP